MYTHTYTHIHACIYIHVHTSRASKSKCEIRMADSLRHPDTKIKHVCLCWLPVPTAAVEKSRRQAICCADMVKWVLHSSSQHPVCVCVCVCVCV
jgi:hypothetical protein